MEIYWSLPMRGAWIEISIGETCKSGEVVAPHAGGVDRNRSNWARTIFDGVAPHAGGVDRNCVILI